MVIHGVDSWLHGRGEKANKFQPRTNVLSDCCFALKYFLVFSHEQKYFGLSAGFVCPLS